MSLSKPFIRYVGHIGQNTGYGRAAEDYCLALLGAGADLEIVPMAAPQAIDRTENLEVLSPRFWDPHATPRVADVTIVHTLPMDCGRTRDLMQNDSSRRWIAYTTWETLSAPAAVCELLRPFDEVWTPSRASAGAFQHAIEPVVLMPHCYHPQTLLDLQAPRDRDPRNAVVRFAWVGAWTTRKNPHGMIKAFCHQFGPEDPVELVMHSPGAELVQCYAAIAQTGLAQSELPKIRFSIERLTDEQMLDFYRGIDVFVSTSRGEAWNLPAFEAMLANKWVVYPQKMGHCDFLDETTNLDIPTHADIPVVTVKAQAGGQPGQVGFVTLGAQGLTSKSLWLEPDMLSLALELHTVYRLVRDGKHPFLDYDVSRYSYEHVSTLMLERIAP